MKKIITYSIILLWSAFAAWEAKAQVFASVELNRKSIYVQQPFHVTITVYTKTWFTAPLEFGNLQIPNAFIVPFDQTQPGMFTVNGKQYPGVQFYYIVFPYKVGNFTVPSLEITAYSPAEGSTQGRKIALKTTPHPFIVKDVPKELKELGTWFVARDVIFHEHWEPALKDLKVGDVLKHTITIDARGTLPQFIPDLSEQEKINWASIYPQDPVLTDTRGGGDANGRSVQTTTYLLEKAGDFTIPRISLAFWNPYTAKTETKSIQAVKIHVNENPNLGILTTLKDSLSATVQAKATNPPIKHPFRILGMTWYAFTEWLIAALLIIYIITKLSVRLFKHIAIRRRKYLNSERYLFNQFQHTNDDSKTFLITLYRWWDHFEDKTSASVSATLESENESAESKAFSNYYESALHGQKTIGTKDIKNSLKGIRTKIKEEKTKDNEYFPI